MLDPITAHASFLPLFTLCAELTWRISSSLYLLCPFSISSPLLRPFSSWLSSFGVSVSQSSSPDLWPHLGLPQLVSQTANCSTRREQTLSNTHTGIRIIWPRVLIVKWTTWTILPRQEKIGQSVLPFFAVFLCWAHPALCAPNQTQFYFCSCLRYTNIWRKCSCIILSQPIPACIFPTPYSFAG